MKSFKNPFGIFGGKILGSFFLVIVIQLTVLGIAIGLALPGALNRHMGMGPMGPMHQGEGGGMVAGDPELLVNTGAAVNEAFFLAAGIALVVAVVLSLWITRQVVNPVRELTQASRELAKGRYDMRVAARSSDELAQLAESFNQMAEQLELTENKRRELIADVSHELLTPLTAVKGYMEGLIDGVLPAEDATYQQVYKEADRLQGLVADLQELSRVQARSFVLNKRPVTLGALLDALKARLERQFAEKGVGLEIEVADSLPLVEVDEDRIGQVLLNLVGNALQYTPVGGKVRVAAKQEGDRVRVSVTDTGVGIAAADLPHVFDRFYRVDKSRSRAGGGSGIGLTIAKHLVEAHGGAITVESAGLDRGSTFSFTIPVAK